MPLQQINYTQIRGGTPNVMDFGAVGDGVTDDTAAIQAALTYANSIGGATIVVPAKNFLLSAPINIYANTTLQGQGWLATKFTFTNTTDGIRSTWPINSSTAANVNVKDISIVNTNGSNLGGGFVDVGGTYVNVENCYIQGWKFGIILDQSELVVIHRNNLVGNTLAQLWIVNGADHTIGANPGFTNRITISDNQFNAISTSNLVLDDGGANHIFIGNNFNAGQHQFRAAAVGLLTFINNGCEGSSGFPIWLADTTYSGATVSGCTGFSIKDNQLGTGNSEGIPGANSNIYIDEAYSGEISGNYFYRATTSAIQYNYGPNFKIANIAVFGNIVYNSISDFARTATPLVPSGQLQTWQQQGLFNQGTTTYSAAAINSGYQQVTPGTMVGIYDGALLRVINNDGTNVETVIASINPVAPTTFFATFATSKAAGARIFVLDGIYSGTYSPTITGSSPIGGATQTVTYGSYVKTGNRVQFQANVTWTALTGGAAGQLRITLPFNPVFNLDASNTIPVIISGVGAIGVGQAYITLTNAQNYATVAYINQTTGNAAPLNAPASGYISISGSYEI